MLALAEYERGLCPDCGVPLHESTRKLLRPDGRMDPDSYDQYEVTAEERCFVCAALDDARDRFANYRSPASLRLQIRRRR